MAAPRVSIVMPAYAAAEFIGLAVESVLAQTLKDWELIIVDDCSPDETAAAAMEAAGGDPRIRVVRAPENGGVAKARNLGMREATGEWIAVLDSDDAMEPGRLEILVTEAEAAHLDIIADDLLLVPFENIHASGEAFLGRSGAPPASIDLVTWLDRNRVVGEVRVIGYLKPMIRRKIITDNDIAYRPDLKVAEDCWFVADLLAVGARFGFYPEALYRYAIRPASLSRSRSTQNAYSMQRPVYASFLARHAGRLSAADRAALVRHETALKTAETFEDFLIAKRNGQLGEGIRALLRYPRAIPLLTRPARLRFRRLAQGLGFKVSQKVG